MKIHYNGDDEVKVTFSSDEEKDIVFLLIKNHIELSPSLYRKAFRNLNFVCDLTNCGICCSEAICEALGVDPYGYEWVKENEK